MKANGNLRSHTDTFGTEDMMRKASKLEPMKKSGKEKNTYFREIEEDDEALDLMDYKKRESVLDYFDDGEDTDTEDEWEEMDEDDADDLDEDWEEDWTDGPEEYDDEDGEDDFDN